jgi:hypothetical protein
MPIQIENKSLTKIPQRTIPIIESIINSVPKSHLRGIERIRIVDKIVDPRFNESIRNSLPGIYHPKQGNQAARLEIAINNLLPESSLSKRLLQRFAYKTNLASTIFSLVGQHYLLTQRHSLKRNQLEGALRFYTQTQMKSWAARENRFRNRLFKPLQPTLEKWARAIQQRAKQNRVKK